MIPHLFPVLVCACLSGFLFVEAATLHGYAMEMYKEYTRMTVRGDSYIKEFAQQFLRQSYAAVQLRNICMIGFTIGMIRVINFAVFGE